MAIAHRSVTALLGRWTRPAVPGVWATGIRWRSTCRCEIFAPCCGVAGWW
ncbi:hypothetical protein I553_3044 [Mycobacterium xenopi 4042]|uniref:Uncharacterized protein n=1 Tax=Mycobacterium xenopi 4042 TaxID=1299334 RepID=X8BJ07_MYCXE|nr:hypothetical protein I553_3044 [Mycobacterium xenopi 4042]